MGGTAPRVHALFEKAKGSVLFIDEAYSLLEERRGSYGDEAINAIVQEMENTRADTAVVFAGYSDRMQEFLGANPGLRSRISFHVDFPDYTPEELCAILRKQALDAQLTLTPEAMERAEEIFRTASRQPGFGNGRFARNLLEQARLRQARRLLKDLDTRPGRTELLTLTADDFALPAECRREEKRPIGFISA